MVRKLTCIVAMVLVFWLMVILYMGVIQSPSDREGEVRLQHALDSMKQQNKELKQTLDVVRQIRLKSVNNVDAKFNQENPIKVSDVKEISISGQTKSREEHERLRRKIDNGVTEFWYYLQAKLKHMKSKPADILSTLDEVLEDGGEQERSIITDIHHLGQSDHAADYMPPAIPEDLAPRLMRLHGHPFVWWIGQFLRYMLRLQPALQSKVDEAAIALGFQKPIVGVHVRRTDKLISEASYHGIEEYMFHVEEYYKLLERREKVDKRRVFLASDDPSVLIDARKNFPDYEFVSDPHISKSAGLGSRFTESSLICLVLDIHFLSQCDFLVCTFSSGVCRLAYEIMQTLHPDASTYFRSLDDSYYYNGQKDHREKAIYEHHPRRAEEIALRPGDEIRIAGNHWDGYSKGTNMFNGEVKAGLYPSYKTVDKTDIAKMPTYPEADNQ